MITTDNRNSLIGFGVLAVVLVATLWIIDRTMAPNRGMLGLFGSALGYASGLAYHDIRGWILHRREATTRKVDP